MARRTQKTVKHRLPDITLWPQGVSQPGDPLPLLPPHATEGAVNVAALMARGAPRDQRLFGQMIEDLLRSATGDLLAWIVEDIKKAAIASGVSSDEKVGILRGLQQFQASMVQYVLHAKRLKDQEEEEKETEKWTQAQSRLGHMPPSSVGAGEAE